MNFFNDIIMRLRNDLANMEPHFVERLSQELIKIVPGVKNNAQEDVRKQNKLSILMPLREEFGSFLKREAQYKPRLLNKKITRYLSYGEYLRWRWLSLGFDHDAWNNENVSENPSLLEKWVAFLFPNDSMQFKLLHHEANFYWQRIEAISEEGAENADHIEAAIEFFGHHIVDIRFDKFFQSENFIGKEIYKFLAKQPYIQPSILVYAEKRIRHINESIIRAVEQYKENMLHVYLQEEKKSKKEIEQQKDEIQKKHRYILDDLEIARRIQSSFLPNVTLSPQLFSIGYHYSPMEKIGGDLFDWVIIDAKQTGFAIMDISGHGIAAALVSSLVKILFDSAVREKMFPKKTLEFINDQMLIKSISLFATMFYGIYNSKSRKLVYANGGHQPPLLLRKGNILSINASGKLLGVVDDIKIEEKSLTIESKDRLILYTDGVTEAVEPSNKEMFGELRLESIIKENESKSAQALADLIFSKVVEFSGTSHQEDDVCIVVVDFL